MQIRTHTIELSTRGYSDIHDLTPQVTDLLSSAGLQEGSVLIFVPGSTAGVTTIEFESGVLADLRDALDRLVPTDIAYAHDARWGDGNGFSHIRAALLKPNLEVPVAGGRLLLGTWQQLVLIDCDNGSRRRSVICQLRGIFQE